MKLEIANRAREVLADRDIDAYTGCMQYSVRGVPPEVDRAIRQRAKVLGKSLNEVAILALAEGVGLGSERVVRRDLEGIAGTWRRETSVEQALASQDEVDEALWK